jgi:hypothetical protein
MTVYRIGGFDGAGGLEVIVSEMVPPPGITPAPGAAAIARDNLAVLCAGGSLLELERIPAPTVSTGMFLLQAHEGFLGQKIGPKIVMHPIVKRRIDATINPFAAFAYITAS